MYRILAFLCIVIPLLACGEDVPRAEYPRPQFQRSEWINLNGPWTCSFDFGKSGAERGFQNSKGFDKTIMVPFCPESKLSGIGYTDFIEDFWYQREITIPDSWKGDRIMLNFGGVYYIAEIYLDGALVDRHYGGSSSFSVDLTDYVKYGEPQSLVVHAESDVRSGNQSAGKQSLRQASSGCNYTRTTGIWQTVWLEAVPEKGLKDIRLVSDIDNKQLVVHPEFVTSHDGSVEFMLTDGNKIVAKKTGSASNHSAVVLPVKNMKLWSPGSPFLYDLICVVKDSRGNVVDEVNSYVGMRKIHTEGNKVYLNNEPYYQRLVLDQGFYPDGIWTAPSDEALKHDIELSKAAGFNGARLHQKVFEPRYHYWADRLGYITWGEAPSWGMDCNDPMTARNFIPEWSEIVARDRNHPSIIIWTPTNEEFWPDPVNYPRFIKDLHAVTNQIDPTRPFHDASGGVHVSTDIWTVHTYEQDPERLKAQLWNDGAMMQYPNYGINSPVKNIGYNSAAAPFYSFPQYKGDVPFIVDEFGGIKWNPDEQTKSNQNQSWGYGEPPATIEEFYSRLESQVDAVLELSDYICGYCYTQLTDVEQEQNGIYLYSRDPKFDMERIRKIFSKVPAKNKK